MTQNAHVPDSPANEAPETLNAPPATADQPTVAKFTAAEVLESLTGHEELMVEAFFTRPLAELSQTMFLRAMSVVLAVRDGRQQATAYAEAMERTYRQIVDQFTPDEDDFDYEFPVTPSGEDEPQRGDALRTSPAGA